MLIDATVSLLLPELAVGRRVVLQAPVGFDLRSDCAYAIEAGDVQAVSCDYPYYCSRCLDFRYGSHNASAVPRAKYGGRRWSPA